MRQKALVTIVGNGGEMFKIWYRYYAQYFEPQDIYILAFNSTDGSTDALTCNVEEYPDKKVCVEQIPYHNVFLNEYKSKLLEKYETIVYADYDEILYYTEGLDKLIDELKDKYLNPFGFEVIQRRSTTNKSLEGVFDYSKSVLSQRAYWYRNISFDKPLITKMDFNWAQGNHAAYASIPKLASKRPKPRRPTAPPKDVKVRLPRIYKPGFYLLHLKHIDYERCELLYPRIDLRKHWLNLGRKIKKIPEKIANKDFV